MSPFLLHLCQGARMLGALEETGPEIMLSSTNEATQLGLRSPAPGTAYALFFQAASCPGGCSTF